MAETSNNQGFVLISAIITLSLLLLMALFLSEFVIKDYKISKSQSTATQAYYLAESGVAEAIWKIKNDITWKTNFETNPSWTTTFTRNQALYDNGTYTINIRNTGYARGEIEVIGSINMGNATAKRVIKTTIYKALGASPVDDSGSYADGNIELHGTNLVVKNGSIFSNGNILVQFHSTANADNAIKAVGNINTSNNPSSIQAPLIASADFPPGPDPIPMPAISFDNPGDPDSYKTKAGSQIYSASDFENILKNNQNLTLNGVTYVTGDIYIKGAQNLIINGALVSDGDIVLGEDKASCCWNGRCGPSSVTVNQISSTTPTGILAKGEINFEKCLSSFNGKALVYANDKINMLSLPNKITISGGLISRKVSLISLWQGIEIIFDNSVISYALGNPLFSPIVTVEHWEEEY